MRKKIFAIFCAIVMAFSLAVFAACNSSVPPAPNSGGVTTPETPGGKPNNDPSDGDDPGGETDSPSGDDPGGETETPGGGDNPGGGTDTPGGGTETPGKANITSAQAFRHLLKNVSLDFMNAEYAVNANHTAYGYREEFFAGKTTKIKAAEKNVFNVNGSTEKHAGGDLGVKVAIVDFSSSDYYYHSDINTTDAWSYSTDANELVKLGSTYTAERGERYLYDGMLYTTTYDGDFGYFGEAADVTSYPAYDIVCDATNGKYTDLLAKYCGLDLLRDDWTFDTLWSAILQTKFNDALEFAHECGMLDEPFYIQYKNILAQKNNLLGNMTLDATFAMTEKLFAAFNYPLEVRQRINEMKDALTGEFRELIAVDVTDTGDDGYKLNISLKSTAKLRELIAKFCDFAAVVLDNQKSYTYDSLLKDCFDIDLRSTFDKAKTVVKGTMSVDDLAKIFENNLAGTGIDRNFIAEILPLIDTSFTREQLNEYLVKYKNHSLNKFILEVSDGTYDYERLIHYIDKSIDDFLAAKVDFRLILGTVYNMISDVAYALNYMGMPAYSWQNTSLQITATFNARHKLTALGGSTTLYENISGGTSSLDENGEIVHHGGFMVAGNWYPAGYVEFNGTFTVDKIGAAARIELPNVINYERPKITDGFSSQIFLRGEPLEFHYNLGYYDDINISAISSYATYLDGSGLLQEVEFIPKLNKIEQTITIPNFVGGINAEKIEFVIARVDLYKNGKLINKDYALEIRDELSSNYAKYPLSAGDFINSFDLNPYGETTIGSLAPTYIEMNGYYADSKNYDAEQNYFCLYPIYENNVFTEKYSFVADGREIILTAKIEDLVTVNKYYQTVTLNAQKVEQLLNRGLRELTGSVPSVIQDISLSVNYEISAGYFDELVKFSGLYV